MQSPYDRPRFSIGILPSLEAPLCNNLAKLWAHIALRLVTTIECPWNRTSSDWSIGPLRCNALAASDSPNGRANKKLLISPWLRHLSEIQKAFLLT
ncbi:hypothetical protein VNO77_02676 [Canavalia gladiata]|uniref:Uncharacterized protein n=1 Tax=Canavalia gladiata TaxID=3824 RepID=A0AAN9MYN0_CANGL